MKQVVLRNGLPQVAEVPAPSPQRGRVLVANAASVISSGTERAAVSGSGGSLPMRAVRNPDLVLLTVRHAREHGIRKTVGLVRNAVSDDTALGYASAGVVLDTGGLGDFSAGQAVACAGAGHANHAEVVSVPGNLVAPVPEGVELRDAAFTTLGAIAMQGVRRAEASLGEHVVVIGLGLLGLLTVQILRAAGCLVLGVEPDVARRELAVQLGAEQALDPEQAVASVREWTGGTGADTAIVTAASSSSAIVNDAVSMVRRKGRVVPLGDVGLAFERAGLYQREADVLISTSYGPGRYDPVYEEAGVDYPLAYVRWTENRNMEEFLRLLAARIITVEPLVGLELPVERAEQAYAALGTQFPPLAAILRYPASQPGAMKGSAFVRIGSARAVPSAQAARSVRAVRSVQAVRSVRAVQAVRSTRSMRAPRSGAPGRQAVRVGVVGPGSFVRSVHLPSLRADGAAPVVAVAARRGTTATNVARMVGGEVEATTDWRRVVEHPKVDLVLIGTRHDSHAQIAAAALNAGKAVFVEKPLGLTREQIDEVWEAGGGEDAPLAIGFNRPLAPLSQRLHEELAHVTGPLQMVIRVNAPLPTDHWLNDPDQGGGRILGEGCHFLDYANWLCGVPLRVSGASVRESSVRTVQNASITVSYQNGSVASLHYRGLGSSSLPKERIEVFAAGRAWVLDDFQRLSSFDAGGSRTVEKGRGDKGHRALMGNVLAACRGQDRFCPGLRSAYAAQSVALAAIEAIGSAATREVPLPD
jgi:predicted dehydrogenase/threonine dehydrogenase-like Zn-dependent dehydrogenase